MSRRGFFRILTVPAVLWLLAVGVGPLGFALWAAVHRWSPDPSVPPEFCGAENLRALIEDPQFLRSLGVTAWVALGAVPLELALGLAVATALDRAGRARGPLLTALLVPAAVAPLVAGIAWWMLFNARFGPVNAFLEALGLPGVEWTIRMPWALLAVIVAVVWQELPLAIVVLLGGLQSVPPALVEAARLEGAGSWSIFRYITLPHLRPFLTSAAPLGLIDVARLYEIPWYLTQGGPGHETVLTGIYLYKLAFSYGADTGRASVLSLLLAAGLTGVSLLYVRLASDGSRRKGTAHA
ncbi:MAG: carbohydrate ABC transporter permease [Planctomycetota bacterium]